SRNTRTRSRDTHSVWPLPRGGRLGAIRLGRADSGSVPAHARTALMDRNRPLVVALTGGIGSGKSAVADLFRARNLSVFDADLVGRERVRRGAAARGEIAEVFGKDMLAPDGQLDRRRMRERVFASEDARHRLEAILHPRVRTTLLEAVEKSAAPPYCV